MKRKMTAALIAVFVLCGTLVCGGAVSVTDAFAAERAGERPEALELKFDGDHKLISPEDLAELQEEDLPVGMKDIELVETVEDNERIRTIEITADGGYFVSVYDDSDYEVERRLSWSASDATAADKVTVLTFGEEKDDPDGGAGHTLRLEMAQDGAEPEIFEVTGTQTGADGAWDNTWKTEGYTVTFKAEDAGEESGSGIAKVTYSKSGESDETAGEGAGTAAFDGEEELKPDEETGKYELVIPDESYDGEYSIRAYDWAGNYDELVIPVRVDMDEPVISDPVGEPPLNDGWVNGSSNITFTAEAVSGVKEVTYGTDAELTDGKVLAADGNGVYSFKTSEQEGIVTYYIKAESSTGAVSEKSVTVKTDITKPTAEIADSEGDHWLSIKKDITLTIEVDDPVSEEGSADNVSGVERVYVTTVNTETGNQESVGEAVKQDDGTYTFTIEKGWFNSSVKDKVYYVYAVDAAGNESIGSQYSVNADKEEPVIESIEISGAGDALKEYDFAKGELFGIGRVTVTVKASDDTYGSGVDTVSIYGSARGGETLAEPAAVDENGVAEFAVPAEDVSIEEDGSLSFSGNIYAMATDKAGNESERVKSEEKLTQENGRPMIEMDGEDEPDTMIEVDGTEYPCYKDDTKISVTVTDEPDDTASGIYSIKVTVNGETEIDEIYDSESEAQKKSKELTVNTEDCTMADDGSYDIEVEATDLSGNTGTKGYRVYKDSVAPKIESITKSPDGEWSAEDVTVTVSAGDSYGPCDSGVAEVRYGTEDDFDKATAAQKQEDGTYTFTISEEGQAEFNIWAKDNAGNVSALGEDTCVSVKVDKTAPEITGIEYDGEGHRDDEDGRLASITEQTGYGYYFRDTVEVTVYAEDMQSGRGAGGEEQEGSGVAGIYYMLVSADGTAPGQPVFAAVDDEGKITFEIDESFKGDIYVKAKDMVGNMPADDPATTATDEGYVHGSGVIVETAADHEDGDIADVSADLPSTAFEDVKGQLLFDDAIEVSAGVSDGMSGIRFVEWTIDAPHDEEASDIGVIEIDNDGNVSGEEEDVALWNVDEDSKDRNLITNVSAVLPIDADSNDITLTLKLTDRAGHKTTVEKVFSVDRSAPVVEVTYDNDSYDEEFAYETEYYKADRTAVITIKDRNFDVNSAAVAITRDGREVRLDELEWEIRPDEEEAGMTCYTTQYLFDRDGDYTILVTAVDMVEHEAEPYGEKAFTIDKTQPMISIEYDNNDGNGGYFDRGRTAVITVREHNFTPDRFVLTAKAALAGAGFDFPEMSDWESDGDIHKATIRFTREGDYEFKAECTDKAGNDCARPLEELFTIDMTAPELSISDIEPNSANAGSVRPGISWSDINLDGPAEIILTGSNQGETSLPGESSDEETSGTFRYDNFPREKEVDDVYTLTAIAADMAGNETEKSVSFSVNRFGSVYTFTPSLSDINGKFLDRERDIVIHEINVDTLDPDSIEVKIAKNGQNAEETEITRQVTSSNVRGSWHMYDYLLPAENFSEEGVYAVAVNSVDRAGNLNDSTEESKEAELRFGIDKSEPLITAINIERDTTYPEDSKKVDFAINDNLLLEDVGVTVNGREVEAKSDGDVYSFTMRGSDEPREITVTAMDGAGNTSELMIPDVYVTKNLFIRWYTNTPLMIVTVCVLGLAAAAAALLFIRKLKLHRHMMREEAAEAENRDM